ncbi:MAG: substrate-binding domain-containing protein [Phycisphaeraceae bacterium]|nr:substrate-binding domain-containing protein [Phycisphaeraceae bacterium]
MGKSVVLIAADTGPAYGRGVVRGALRFGRHARLWSWEVQPIWEIVRGFDPRSFQGVIAQVVNEDLHQRLMDSGLPVVNVGDNLAPHGMPSVFSDHQAIGQMAAAHLRNCGIKRFAYFGDEGDWYAKQRAEGFSAAIRQFGYELSSQWYFQAGPVVEYPALNQWLAEMEKPTGLLAANDILARRIVETCKELGLRVPEDVAVVGVDDDEMICETAVVPISSVAIAAERVGYEAAALLARLLEGEPAPREVTFVPPLSVVRRQSSDILSISDANVAAAVRYIHQNCGKPIGVEDVVDQLTISRRQLEQRFRAAFNRSPAEEIRRVRVEKVKEMLDNTDWNLARIAGACGFSDASIMGKSFRDLLGITPTQYRLRTRLD